MNNFKPSKKQLQKLSKLKTGRKLLQKRKTFLTDKRKFHQKIRKENIRIRQLKKETGKGVFSKLDKLVTGAKKVATGIVEVNKAIDRMSKPKKRKK